MVLNTRELLPEPETPVNTVSRRFGSSMLTSLRLFTRAPCTRIRSWLSAACVTDPCGSLVVTVLIVSPFSVEPTTVTHELSAGQLVDLPPGLDPARADPKPVVRRGKRPRVEAGARGEPVADHLRERVDRDHVDRPL